MRLAVGPPRAGLLLDVRILAPVLEALVAPELGLIVARLLEEELNKRRRELHGCFVVTAKKAKASVGVKYQKYVIVALWAPRKASKFVGHITYIVGIGIGIRNQDRKQRHW